MTCNRKLYSITLCCLFLVLVSLYIDLNTQSQIDVASVKQRFLNLVEDKLDGTGTASNEGWNIKFINVLNVTGQKHDVITTSRTWSAAKQTQLNNSAKGWPLIQTTSSVPSAIRSNVHIKAVPGAIRSNAHSISVPGAIRSNAHIKAVPGAIRSNAHIIFVVSYMRSGSSLTADMMQHFPKTFYVFEPFHEVVVRTKSGLPLHYIDGSVRRLKMEDITEEFIQNELLKWIDCRLAELDINSLTDVFHAQFSRSILPFFKCVERGPKTIRNLKECLPLAIDRCKETKHRLFKFIRLPMNIVRNIFNLYPNLQVIHLVRDPRGTLNSQIRVNSSSWDVIDTTSYEFCHRVEQDLNMTVYLNYYYPNRSKILIYEKLAENPIEVAKMIFNYINIEPYSYVLRYISKMTQEGRQNGPFGYYRRNSTVTAYSWRDKINFTEVSTIDKNCGRVYNFIGYQKFINNQDLKNHNLETLITHNHPIYIVR